MAPAHGLVLSRVGYAAIVVTSLLHLGVVTATPLSLAHDRAAEIDAPVTPPRIFPAPRQGEPKWAWIVRAGGGLSVCRHEPTGVGKPAVCGPAWKPDQGESIRDVYPVTRQVTWLWSWVVLADGSLRACRAPGVSGKKLTPVCSANVTLGDGVRVDSLRPIDRVGAGQWAWVMDDSDSIYVCRFNSTSDSVAKPNCPGRMQGPAPGNVLSVHPIVQTGNRQLAWMRYGDGMLGVCSFETGDDLPTKLDCAPPTLP